MTESQVLYIELYVADVDAWQKGLIKQKNRNYFSKISALLGNVNTNLMLLFWKYSRRFCSPTFKYLYHDVLARDSHLKGQGLFGHPKNVSQTSLNYTFFCQKGNCCYFSNHYPLNQTRWMFSSRSELGKYMNNNNNTKNKMSLNLSAKI